MTDTPSDLLRATPLLDFDHPTIRDLIAARGWAGLAPFGRIGAAYDFVRDEIAFGYNRDDASLRSCLRMTAQQTCVKIGLCWIRKRRPIPKMSPFPEAPQGVDTRSVRTARDGSF